mgnify:CR=1 FL=1
MGKANFLINSKGNTLIKVVGVLVVLIIIIGGAFVLWIGLPKGPKLAEVRHLREPRIVDMPVQKMLVVKAAGAPNEVGKHAFGLLMNTYFKLDGVPKGGPEFKPPRARWPVNVETPHEEWVGHYGMPVPESVTTLPDNARRGELTAELVEWEYGDVAEVLHVGSYAGEEPTVEALKKFIHENGYKISGHHEEEYLKGPGLIFAGNPEEYLTLIRYPVKKRGEEQDTSAVEESPG